MPNIISAFFETALKMGPVPCAHFKRSGKWGSLSWIEMSRSVKNLASHIKRLGMARGERVAIISNSRIEWTIADCAILAAGAVTVPIYTSLTPANIGSIVKDCAPQLAFIENEESARKFREARETLGLGPIRTILFEDETAGEHFASILAGYDHVPDEEIENLVSDIGSDDIATIVYTSGTTGRQKGAIITHGNIFSEVRAVQEIFDFRPDEIGLVCLPLAHVLGRLMQFYQLTKGCQAAYAEGIDKIAQNFKEVRPHFVCGVPRMLEKAHELIWLKVDKSPNWRKKLFAACLKAGMKRGGFIQKRRQVPWFLKFQYFLADMLAFRRIRAGLGGRLRCFICGGAPLKEDIAKFFHAAGLSIIEGYGLTETFAAATANRFDDYHFGTVGKALPSVDLKISSDGEILFRGPTVFKGYLNLPDETKEAFDSEGWFRTGDIGEYSRDGFLRITGRKKEIIVTAGGKNIAPQMIESLMGESPYINYFLAYGDGRKYLTGLLVLNAEAARQYLTQHGFVPKNGEPLAGHFAIRELIARQIEEKNKSLASFETIKKFAIVDGDFSVAGGELTPTLKIRRSFICEKYKDLLGSLY